MKIEEKIGSGDSARITRLFSLLGAVRDIHRLLIREGENKVILHRACKELVESGIYRSSWIILFKSDDTLDSAFESGVRDAFGILLERVGKGEKVECLKRAFADVSAVVIGNKDVECGDCPLAGKNKNESAIVVPLESAGKFYGVLNVTVSDGLKCEGEEIKLLNDLGSDIAHVLGNIELEEERRKIEKLLRRSEVRFRTFFESANDSIFIMDESIFIDCNDATVRMFGCDSKNDILSHSPWEFSPELQPDGQDSRIKALGYIAEALKGNPQRFYWVHSKKDGSLFDAEVSLNALVMEGKTFIQAIVRDISEQKKAQDELKKSEELYRLSFTNATDVIYTISLDGCLLSVSPSVERILGYKPEELVGRNFEELNVVAPGYYEKIIEDINRVAMGERIETAVYEFLTKDGRRIIGEISGAPLIMDGKPKAIVSIARDITERVQFERIRDVQYKITRAMASAEDLGELFTIIKGELSALLDTENLFFALYDKAKDMLYSIYEYDEKDNGPSSWEAGSSITGRVVKSGKTVHLRKEEILKLADSGDIDIIGTIPEVWLGVPLYAGEKVVGAMVIQDYDKHVEFDARTIEMLEIIGHGLGGYIERKRVEGERERLAAAIDQAAESVIITDPVGKIEYVNPSFERITGYSRDEVIGKNPRILRSGKHDQDFYRELWDTISSGRV